MKPGAVPLEADALLQREELVQPAALDVRGDVVRQLRGGRSGTRRVRRSEDLVVADRLEQAQRRLEGGLGFAAEPHDDVGRDGDSRNGLPDAVEALPVVLDRVLASHAAERAVVARLDRQMEVLADAVAL